MSTGSETYDAFISYSRADSGAAESLRARLKEAGLSAFLDRYGLPAGQQWQPWLEEHLLSCRALIVLVGPLGFGEWQHREIQLGLDRQASAAKAGQAFSVIPVLLPGLANDAVPAGSFLSLNTWVDLRPGLDEPESLQRLVAGAQGRAIDTAAAERLLAGLIPYRGLLPFREQDAGLFFGRDRFVEDLVRKVGQRSATNVVAVMGRSGSGKSSIVYAGLFPKLRGQHGLGGQSVWQILHLRPHAEPLHELARAFDPPKDDLGPMDVRATLNKSASLFRDRQVRLADLVHDRLRNDPGSTRLLLYVDQWEELYTLAAPREPKTDEERARAADAKLFIDLVLEAAARSDCTVVLSARSDFYPDIQNHDGLRVAVQESQVSLGTMNEAELRAVIEGPCKALGVSVDKKLTEKLIRDIGLDPASGRSDEYDIGKLPLLEYALEQAWMKRTESQIGVAQYSGLEQALEERANALYGRLSAEEQAAAKRLFVSLVTPGEGREDTRARIEMPGDEAMRRVIQTFAGGEARLIVTDEASGRGSVEVSHEALIRHWDKLRGWIDENRDKLRTRDFLKANRAEWLKRNRDPSLLDLPNLYVEAARSLHEQPGDVVINDVNDYIEALLDREKRRHEEQKQVHEAEQRKELERANERAEAARRLVRRRAVCSSDARRGLRASTEGRRGQTDSGGKRATNDCRKPKDRGRGTEDPRRKTDGGGDS
jgi:TIR domain